MLLRQLVDYRPADGPPTGPERPYSRERAVRWQLELAADGALRGLTDLADPSDKTTKNGLPRRVPHIGRTVGIAPILGVDDVQYVLGWADDKAKPDRVAAAHTAFVALCRRWAGEYPDDPLARAVVAFYDRANPPSLARPDAKWASKDVVAIAVGGRPVTDSETLWQCWSRVVEQRKSGSGGRSGPPGAAEGGADGGRRGLCLVCGQPGTLLNRLPQALPKTLVPRADQEIALISANKPIHTYDFSSGGLATAPICIRCGQSSVANLHTILDSRDHTFTYERQRTRLAWWVTNGGDEESIAMLDADPSAISDFLRRVVDGTRPRALPEHELCSVTISGNVARLVVHDWLEQPLARAEESVVGWFRAHEIAHRFQDTRACFPIWRLVLCAGQWQPGTGEAGGRYVPLYDKAADRPDDLAQLLLHSALHGSGIPPYVLAHVVRRVRTDGHVDESRAALLRVALTRHPNPSVEKAPMPGLDITETNPAYVSGRLFATLEATQRAAYRGDQEPNTNFFDRYFAGAVANPRIAMIQGGQLHAAWLRKIRTSAERQPTSAERERRRAAHDALRRRLDELFGLLTTQALPDRITTAEQSRFIVGYHHQRANDLAMARAGRAPEVAPDDQGPTEPTSV